MNEYDSAKMRDVLSASHGLEITDCNVEAAKDPRAFRHTIHGDEQQVERMSTHEILPAAPTTATVINTLM